MVMRHLKRVIVLTLICLFIPILMPIFSFAQTDKQRIFDEANLLSTEEVAELEKIAQEYGEKQETDFIILTQKNPEKDMKKVMADFYDNEAFGYNARYGNTVMLGLDMTNRDVVLLGFGKGKTHLDPDRLTSVREKITPALSDGDYYAGFISFIKISDKYMKFKPKVNPENPLYKTWGQLAVAVALGAIVVIAMAWHVKPKMTTKPSTYRDENRTRILQKRDKYLRTTVTKRKKPTQNNSGGSGGGGGYGRTSGGHSYSSSRGKF